VPLWNLARYYRDNRLIGEARAAITTTIALAGDASVIVRGLSGTGKSHLSEVARGLLPDELVTNVDMVSKLSIWSKPSVKRINAARIVYFPEDQNASDNDEIVKIKKKWGDGRPAEREKSEDYGNDSSIATLEPKTFLSTAAITNEAHGRTFDAESARRVVKLSTNPSAQATADVLASMAHVMKRGKKAARSLSLLEAAAVRKHVAKTMSRTDITGVRFLGADALLASVPTAFPEARSAVSLFQKVLLGVGRWYADDELVIDGEVYLSPSRVAEAWAFYGDILCENALKMETLDREILHAFPNPVWQGEAVAPECLKDLNAIMRALKPAGITDPGIVKGQIAKLLLKGFLAEAQVFRGIKWHRTDLSDTANAVDWKAVYAECRREAPEVLEGEALATYLAKCDVLTMQNPLTGKVGPIMGNDSVLYHDDRTGAYTPVGRQVAKPQGIEAWAGAQ
jgi:hypothetical protein